MFEISHDLVWWITVIDLPALGGLFWMIWRTRKENENDIGHLRDVVDSRNAQMREALAAFKLEVAKSYASVGDMRELEARLVSHLLRIEAKLDSTALKTEAPIRDTPQAITVISRQTIAEQSMQGMADLVRFVPGIQMAQGEGNRDTPIFRGNSSTADFYVDGVRDDAQVFRDLYNLERVEVLKGPAGMVFGRGGAGGVVNRVMKKPTLDPVGEMRLTVGSWNQLRDTIDLGHAFGDSSAWRLNAMAEDSASFRKDVLLKRWAVNPTAMVQSENTALTFGYEHLTDERTADRGIPSQSGRPYSTDPGNFFGNAAQSKAHSYVDSAYAIVEHDLGGRSLLRDTFRATYYDKYYQNVYPGSAVDAAGDLTLSAYINANQRSNFFNQTDYLRKF